MVRMTFKASFFIAALSVIFGGAPADAEVRWDGFNAKTPRIALHDFGSAPNGQTSRPRENRSFDFNEKETFKKEFETESFRDKVRKRLTILDRNR